MERPVELEFVHYDLIVRNALVVDGTGAPGRVASLAVTGGRIAAIGDLVGAGARAEVDGAGLALCPGFIDMHSHADLALLVDPLDEPKITQGVTTEVVGNCGLGFAPALPQASDQLREAFGALFPSGNRAGWGWPTLAAYRRALADARSSVNVATLASHAAVRAAVMGFDGRPAESGEIRRMADMVRACGDEGAIGLSTGLEYSPMCDATVGEVAALARAAGRLAIHQRSYGPDLMTATAETLAIARDADVPVQLSHLQTSGPANIGRSWELLELIDSGCRDGADLTFDSYPYCAGATVVHAMLPAWCKGNGMEGIRAALSDESLRYRIKGDLRAIGRDWSRTVLMATEGEDYLARVGSTFADLAADAKEAPEEIVCRLVESGRGAACYLVHHMEESDLEAIMAHPRQCFGSDGLYLERGGHPRLWGTFARVLGRYVRERRLLSFEDAVRRITNMPATRLGLRDRGRLAVGCWADMVLVDPGLVGDMATYEAPSRRSVGVRAVWVNGHCVVDGDGVTGARGGVQL